MSRQELEKLLEKTVHELGEHFDTVQIVATNYDGATGITQPYSRGIGNWYARHASCEELVRTARDESVAKAIAEQSDPPDDSEEWKDRA